MLLWLMLQILDEVLDNKFRLNLIAALNFKFFNTILEYIYIYVYIHIYI